MLSFVMVFAMIATNIPTATAASATEYYTDKNGNTIAKSTSSTTADEEVTEFDGYAYVSQSNETTYVYSHNDTHARYINGYPDGSVRADSSITRAETVQMLYNLFGSYFDAYVKMVYDGDINTLEANASGFSDVEKGTWYYNAVLTLNDMGVIKGYGDNTFRPDNYITRAEYCKIISLVDQLVLDETAEDNFKDISGHWARAYINAAAGKGWLQGYPDKTFRPDRYISRAEAVTLANAVMGRVTNSTPTGFTNPYNDVKNSHWAYLDIMEASDTHIASDWHNAGEEGITGLNIVTKRYIDTNNNEISETTTETIEATESKSINGYIYCGMTKVITYVYKEVEKVAIPSIIKTASVSQAEVGDKYIYTIELSNSAAATAAWKDVVLTDELSEYLTFAPDSVTTNGKSSNYTYDNRTLSVAVGDISIGQTVTVTFDVEIRTDAQSDTIFNTAIGTGGNGTARDTDNGVYVPLHQLTDTSQIYNMLMQGYEDGTFRPANTLSRAEAVQILYRILAISTGNKYQVTYTAANAFTDVTKDKYYYEALDFLVTSGAISTASDTFRPDDAITRAEYCTIFAKALDLTNTGSTTTMYTDLPTTHWAYNYIYAVLENGWIDANGTTFDPNGTIFRQDAARLVTNAQSGRLELAAQIDTSLYPSYSDVGTSHSYYRYIIAASISTDYLSDGTVID